MQFIRSFFSSIGTWWKRQRTLAKAGMIIAVVIALFVVLGKGKGEAPVIETAMRQDLARSVIATGTVVSATDLSLSFQESNIVRMVNVTIGQKVQKGQVLATLSNASEAAAVAQARAGLLAAEAKERKAQEGAGGEEVELAEVAVANARRTLYSETLVAKDEDGNSVGAPTITGSYNGTAEGKYVLTFDRSTSEVHFTGLEEGRLLIGTSAKPLGTKGLLVTFPQGKTYGIGDEWTIEIPNKDGANYTANLGAYQRALAELELKKTVAPSDVDAARADVASAQASLASAQAAFEKTVIRAPSSGTVTKVDIKPGQLAETFHPVITIQDIENLYVEADVNESNISNVAIGQPVTITYDAFGKNVSATSTVSSVDLGATVVDGIVNFKVKTLVPDATSVRPGMTANLSIQTAFVPGVVALPDRVIETKGSEKIVHILIDERKQKSEERVVTTGLRGDGGLTEVISGISEGERVIFTPR